MSLHLIGGVAASNEWNVFWFQLTKLKTLKTETENKKFSLFGFLASVHL